MRLKEKLIRFMQGRYGPDQLSRTLLIIAVVIMLFSSLCHLHILYYLSLIILGYVYFRMFSKNIPKRYQENQLYLSYEHKFKNWIINKKKILQDKEHRYFYCPSCKQRIRVPKGRGKIAISCPKCHTEFIKKT